MGRKKKSRIKLSRCLPKTCYFDELYKFEIELITLSDLLTNLTNIETLSAKTLNYIGDILWDGLVRKQIIDEFFLGSSNIKLTTDDQLSSSINSYLITKYKRNKNESTRS